MVSQLKAYYGDAATQRERVRLRPASEAAESTPPARTRTGAGRTSSTACIRGDMEGFFSFGMNPVSNGPHSRKAVAALSKLKWLVVVENFETGDGRVLASGHPGARRHEDRGRPDRSVHAAGRQLRREGRLVRQLGPLDPVEVEGGRSAGRGEAGSGNHRADLPEGPRALSDAKAARSPSRSRI